MDRFREAGIQLVGISYDSVDVLKNFAEANAIAFPLLSDPESRTIREFGIHFQDGLPHPGTFLVAPDKTVLSKIFRDGYRDRHGPDALLDAAARLRSGGQASVTETVQ